MERKEAIVQAATKLFSEKGYRETSVAELCKMTDVAEGTIFYHFKTKEALFVIVLERIVQDIISKMKSVEENENSHTGMDQLEQLIAHYLSLTTDLGSRYLLLHRHFSYELARENRQCRRILQTLYTFLLDMFEKPVRRGVKDGSIRPLSSKKIAFILFALIDGILRIQTFHLYDSTTLFQEALSACRHMLQNSNSSATGTDND